MKHNNIQSAYRSVSLTSAERAEVLSELRAHIHAGIPSAFGPTRSPFSVRTAVAFSLVIAIATGTGGVTYASQTALPGDTLYTVKRSYENLSESLTISKPARVRLAGTHATKRIKEAAVLRVRGYMTQDIEQSIAKDLQQHLSVVVDALSSGDTSPEVTSESAVVVAKVAGYANVLAGTDNSAELSTQSVVLGVISDNQVIDTAQAFVGAHEFSVTESMSGNSAINMQQLVGDAGIEFATQTSDPLAVAAIDSVVTSELVSDETSPRTGDRVMHAIADIAEGVATSEIESELHE